MNYCRFNMILLLMGCSLVLEAQINFIEQAEVMDIDHSYKGIPPGGGVSFADFDGDGWDDLTLATGNLEPLQFYQNQQGSLTRIFPLVNHVGEAQQVLWVDFDNDGDKDFYVATYGGYNRLYENKGNLSFENITETAGLPKDENFHYGACFGDYNRDGYLDLYYSERLGPQSAQFNKCKLFKNNGDGTFTETTDDAGVGDLGKKAFCSAFFDYNNDGWPDIYTANDKFSINTLFKNNGDGSYTEVTQETNSDLVMNAMSVAIGDYDSDGWSDIYISNTEEGNALLHNKGFSEGEVIVFEELANQSGVGYNGIAWGSNFFDADNDADLDLYVSGGALTGTMGFTSILYKNNGDGELSFSPNIFEGDTLSSYSNAIGDYDNNGYPDIMVINKSPYSSQLWKNRGLGFNWIKINLQGILSNRDAIGVKLEIFSGDHYQMRYTHCGIGFLGQNSRTLNIGLNDLEVVDSILVYWPTGHIDRVYQLTSNQLVTIQEGSSTGGMIYVDPTLELLTTSTNEIFTEDAEEFINIHPNPAFQYLYINPSKEIEIKSLYIANSKGQLIFQDIAPSSSKPLLISSFPPGLYFLVMNTTDRKRIIKKWIKQ